MIRLTFDNYSEVVPEKDKVLVRALLVDINNINRIIAFTKKELWLSFEDEHTEYSPERTDPCPDYFGTYRLHNSFNNDTIGIEMTLDELDTNLCTLYDFCETFLRK